MKQKTVLITGATAGIGQEAAKQLATMGANVVIAGRNTQKCQSVAEKLKRETENDQIHYLVADLSHQAGVEQLGIDFKARFNRLDVLLNNAGAFYMNRIENQDQIEMTVALNHLGYFVLTHSLLDVLKATPNARIINVASDAHSGARLNPDDFEMKSSFSGWTQYSNSKLMNILFTYELAKRLKGTNVTANCLHPGFVASDFGDNNGKGKGIFGDAINVVWRLIKKMAAVSVEKGAENQVYLASSPDVEGVSGQYFVKKKAIPSSNASYDTALSDALWAWSEVKTGISVAQ